MKSLNPAPRVVLLCHHDERFDLEGLASWLATTMRLVGLVVIHESPTARWRALDRERRRGGWTRAADVLAFRAYRRLVEARRDAEWTRRAVAQLTASYPVAPDDVPRIDVDNPNSAETQAFIRRVAPDLAIARSRRLLIGQVSEIPACGTFALYPGICPEYRDAHGCFWALSRRDLSHVGMTLLRIDPGAGASGVYLQAGCRFDERSESHTIIEYRVVLDNLEVIRRALVEIVEKRRDPIDVEGRASHPCGLPRLSALVRWKRAAQREPPPRTRHPSDAPSSVT